MTRRELLLTLPAAWASWAPAALASAAFPHDGNADRNGALIDRATVVRRHDIRLRALDPRSPLSVGNGELAFTADITGLQTFPAAYDLTFPLCTQAQWGWHSVPSLDGRTEQDLALEPYDAHGRSVGYATRREGQEGLFDWLRENPHRLHLGRVGLLLRDHNGATIDDPRVLTDVDQHLDLWSGILTSRFRVGSTAVEVVTACHPERDVMACTIRSPLLARGQLAAVIEFPYASSAISAADWTQRDRHVSRITHASTVRVDIARQLDATAYAVAIRWTHAASLKQDGAHRFVLHPGAGAHMLAFSCQFLRTAQVVATSPPSTATAADSAGGGELHATGGDEGALAADRVFDASRRAWERFWSAGGAIDFSAASDPRAAELERRVVLSQYLTRIQCAGSMPPQETGLSCNSWYGKFHLEMHWWHAAHFALWGRTPLLERSLGWYETVRPSARARAASQGFAGARWPKMTGPEGRDSPSPIGPLLIWQQPHPIALAELCYQTHRTRATLERYRDMVFDTAAFMTSYAVHDARTNRFVLGPPVIPVQEIHRPRETWNPTFELVYWAHALELAQQWRERLSLARDPDWEAVRVGLAPLPMRNGLYLAHEHAPDTFTTGTTDHPSMLMALGMLPGAGVDREVMRATLRKVMASWHWDTTWGWDYPMVAMTAARLAETALAIDALLIDTPKNHYLPNGHNPQRANLPLYLPGNGGLLATVALMAAGWSGGPATPAPGFPPEWQVRSEGFAVLL